VLHNVLLSILTLVSFFTFIDVLVFADEKFVHIPFGAYNPELNTPAEVWYDPPSLTIKVGDIVTWLNDDREGHTVTSGIGSGRFGWMGENYGAPDGHFVSGRFLPGDSWSYMFEDSGMFRYFCSIHPWMEAVINVELLIPDYPHDANRNKIDKFPVIDYTADEQIEVDITWEPHVIRTNEKVIFVYQTYDPATNSNLDKMNYDLIITQNDEEIFRDSGITQVGGDYRNVIFEEPGPITIRFENIVSWGSSGIDSPGRTMPSDPSFRIVQFTAMVYENVEKTHAPTIIQPKQTFQFYYEIAVIIILIPAGLFVLVLWRMKSKKHIVSRKATPI